MWINWSFDVLIGLFERFVLQTNMAKTVEVVCQPGNISGRQSTAEYGQRIEKGDSHHVRQILRTVCEYCGAEIALASMTAHLQ